ncbi:FHA domain-containing protein [Ottowia sp. VDI28]|uniref:FHA domain-containing protein n=1 Tax=Ottowia sp. VDI28 TaxID=3133968 RepID=UPI003C2E7BA5
MHSPLQTIAFIDLADSTAAYQAMGSEEVAGVISKVTQWIGRVCEAHDGRILKFLGDGVMAEFGNSVDAVTAAVFLQQQHTKRIRRWPEPLHMGLKIGLASGAVVRMGNDAYGDPVNFASRLSDMSGSNAIWATESVINQLRTNRRHRISNRGEVLENIRYRSLGMIRIKGIVQPHPVFQIEWNDEIPTDLITIRGVLQEPELPDTEKVESHIELGWEGNNKVFVSSELPIQIGRVPDCHFVISDPRVSRKHSTIEWINGAFVLADQSTYGTWIRFTGKSASEVQLRRSQCILHSGGEMALGVPFSDASAPVLSFQVRAG